MESRDKLSSEARSANMRAIRSYDTKPELILRSALWHSGTRYRLRTKIGRARPDIVFPSKRVAVFVDGCFWHGCPKHYQAPTGNSIYWSRKIAGNQVRDLRNNLELQLRGWKVVRIWECEVKKNVSAAVRQVQSAIST